VRRVLRGDSLPGQKAPKKKTVQSSLGKGTGTFRLRRGSFSSHPVKKKEKRGFLQYLAERKKKREGGEGVVEGAEGVFAREGGGGKKFPFQKRHEEGEKRSGFSQARNERGIGTSRRKTRKKKKAAARRLHVRGRGEKKKRQCKAYCKKGGESSKILLEREHR